MGSRIYRLPAALGAGMPLRSVNRGGPPREETYEGFLLMSMHTSTAPPVARARCVRRITLPHLESIVPCPPYVFFFFFFFFFMISIM